MMKNYTIFICLSLIVLVFGLPVTPPKDKKHDEKKSEQPVDEVVLEYERYLQEVVEALENDPDFRKKLDKAPEADIRSGKIAQELEYVSHHVRSKLDEIKRREVDRLRELAKKEYELTNDIDRSRLKIGDHLHHENEYTFEIEDLKKLILKAASDLAEVDKNRRADFKQYEMQKEFEKQEKLKSLDEQHRKDYEVELEKRKHNKHEKLHHPGNKAQLEEVWEKQDHMDGLDFDPKMFFQIHDVDGNGFWDEVELKALFKSNLDKAYQSGVPEVDLRERAEEMERMREHVFAESDKNHDGLISYDEFLQQTYDDKFVQDPEWETIDTNPQFTHEEYLEFERKRQEEIQRLIAQGSLPPHANMPQGYYVNPPQYEGNEIPHGYPSNQQNPQMHYQQQSQHQQQQQQYHQQQQQYQQQQPQYNQQPPQQQHQANLPIAQQQVNPVHQPQQQQQNRQYNSNMPPPQQQANQQYNSNQAPQQQQQQQQFNSRPQAQANNQQVPSQGNQQPQGVQSNQQQHEFQPQQIQLNPNNVYETVHQQNVQQAAGDSTPNKKP